VKSLQVDDITVKTNPFSEILRFKLLNLMGK